ncbi:MAG: recombination regulator RecX [Aquabacterium sp.]|nr:MAG: recombination regulator RecX [Aquabacterium sp.]
MGEDGAPRDERGAERNKRPEPSLKARALRFLAAREHSRVELARKLTRYTEDHDEIDRALDELAAKGWLSSRRFVESVVHRKSARLGAERIRQELRGHGIAAADSSEALDGLRASEGTRAYQLWLRRFGEVAEEPEARARQARFLIGRGFPAGIAQRIVRGAWQPTEDEGSEACGSSR